MQPRYYYSRVMILAGVLALPGTISAQPRPLAQLVRPISGKLWKPVETVTVQRGQGEAQLGISAPGDDAPARGPNAISLLAGKIIVVDGENKRAVRFLPNNKRSVIPLKHARTITDMASVGNAVVAYDSSRARMTLIQESGQVRDLDGPPIEKFRGIEAVSGDEIVVRSASKSWRYRLDDEEDPSVPRGVGTRRMRKVARPPTAEKNTRAAKIYGDRSVSTYKSGGATRIALLAKDDDTKIEDSVALAPPVPGELLSVTQLGGDNKGRIYLRLELLTETSPLKIRKFIRVLDGKLRTLDDIEIPVAGVIVPEKDIAIGEDGSIAVLVPTAERTLVVRLSAP